MDKPDYKSIVYTVEDGVARIVFNLPQYGNALDLTGVQETLDALFHAEADDGVGAVMFTGAGVSFCAGFNLKEIPDVGDGQEGISAHFRELAMWWHQVFHMIVRIKKPVLSAVNGAAAGSGLGITLCSDMAVCTDDARFLCAWHSIGLANDASTSYSLVKIVGFRRAMELMYTNRTLSAADALDWQIVNRVYGREDFAENADQIAKQLAAGPTHLQGMAKESFHMGWRRSIEEATEFEIQNVRDSVMHPYFKQALEKFLDKKTRSNNEVVRLP